MNFSQQVLEFSCNFAQYHIKRTVVVGGSNRFGNHFFCFFLASCTWIWSSICKVLVVSTACVELVAFGRIAFSVFKLCIHAQARCSALVLFVSVPTHWIHSLARWHFSALEFCW